MTSYLESLQSSTCVWFEVGEKRNVLVSMLAGTLVNIEVYVTLCLTLTLHLDLSFSLIVQLPLNDLRYSQQTVLS